MIALVACAMRRACYIDAVLLELIFPRYSDITCLFTKLYTASYILEASRSPVDIVRKSYHSLLH